MGADVRRAAVGDRVFGLERAPRVHNGTFAEYVVLPDTVVARTPDTIDDAFAALRAGALGKIGVDLTLR